MQDLIRHLPAVLYEYTICPDGKRHFTYVSESSKSILNLEAQDILKDPLLLDSIVHENDQENLRSTSDEAQKNATEWNWQGRMMVKGKAIWVEIRSNHERKTDGTIVRRGLIQDVTARKENAQQTEIRYQSLVERMPVGIAIHHHGKIVYGNEQAYAIIGAKTSDNLIGRNVMDFVHPDYRAGVTERIKRVLQGENVPMVEEKYVRLDGKTIVVEATAFPFEFQGTPCIQVIFKDITERKQSEWRMKRNEMMFTQLFQIAPMAVIMLDESGKVKQINKGFEEIFGYDLSELRGKSVNDFIVPDELLNEGIDLNNLIAANQVISVETIRKNKEGKLLNVILYGMPVSYEEQIIGIYGIYVDITDRKKVEEELKVRNIELDNFVYKVSHDLRAPLSSVLGLVNLAKLPGNTDNPMEYIEIIGEKIGHLDHFIGDVLSHSKNLKMELNVAKVDLNAVIDGTFTDLNYLEGAKEIKKNVKVEGIDFYSDIWRISEIMRNLISNAIKYRQLNGSQAPEIFIKAHVDNLCADISFSDNGIGIDQKDLNKIFEMFYRATEQSNGSGIGLYIVKNAVEKLGGQISVASKLRQGTRFNIIIPNRINNIVGKPTTQLADRR